MLMMHNYFLHPENIVISIKPAKITTVLGSCVSVCIYDTRLKYGGINHYLLPVCTSNTVAKCGNKAISSLIEKMIAHGSKRIDLIAKIVGGANMLINDRFSVGTKNVMIANKVLQNEKIAVLESNIGGNFGRKLIFYTHKGVIKVDILKSTPKISE